MTQSALEAAFSLAWRIYAPDCERPLEQYRFAAIHVGLGPGLRERLADAGLQDWRFDFAFPWATPPLAIECDGGQWSPHGGRHNTDGDRAKLNKAAALGWRVMRFSASMLADPEAVIKTVKEAL
jgi:hypothetical protein